MGAQKSIYSKRASSAQPDHRCTKCASEPNLDANLRCPIQCCLTAFRAFAIETFGGRHDYVFVQHLDDEHPHVHLTVRSLGYDGKRLNPRKGDLATWREHFAGELRLRGVEAEATPRRARGKVRKAEHGVVRTIRNRGEQPRVERLAREEIVSEARAGKNSLRPWEAKTRNRQAAIRDSYRIQAGDLERSGDPAITSLRSSCAGSPPK